MDHDHDDPLLQQHKHQLSTPLLDEPALIKCIKFPLVYLVTLPRTTLLPALSPTNHDNEVEQLHIAPSPAYADILEVRHVQVSQGGNEKEDERHHHPSVATPPGLAHIQEQDRLTHVNGQPVHSIEQLQRRLSESKEKEETVTVRLLRKLNPYAEYVDIDDLSSSSSSSSSISSSSGDSSSYYYSSSQDDADQDTSLLTMLMTGGGCLSFSPSSSPSLSSSSSSSLTSTSAASSRSSSSRLSTAQNMPVQPYESWGDAASLESTFYKPLWCFPLFLYLIQGGDTLPSLARSFGLKIDVLRRDNRDKFKVGEPAGMLIPGQKLRVRNVEYDGKATAAMVARGGGGGGGREGGWVGGVVVRVPSSKKDEEDKVCYWAERQQQQQQQQQERRHHVVVGGETMKGLCARYGVSELDIRRSNRTYFPLGERRLLGEGMRLVIFPSAGAPAAGAPAPPAAGSYMSPSAVGALWKRKGGSSSPLSSSPRTSSSGSNSSSSSSSSSGSERGKGGGREGGGDARPVLFPVVDIEGVV